MDKPLVRLIKKERAQIKSKRRKVITDITEVQRIIRNDEKQLYANTTYDLEEMDNFLQRLNLPRLNL